MAGARNLPPLQKGRGGHVQTLRIWGCLETTSTWNTYTYNWPGGAGFGAHSVTKVQNNSPCKHQFGVIFTPIHFQGQGQHFVPRAKASKANLGLHTKDFAPITACLHQCFSLPGPKESMLEFLLHCLSPAHESLASNNPFLIVIESHALSSASPALPSTSA